MSYVAAIRDGETISHKELMSSTSFKTERAIKNWIADMNIPYLPVNGIWFVAGEDVRTAMRLAAQTHFERQGKSDE